jgi:hypothetical protein
MSFSPKIKSNKQFSAMKRAQADAMKSCPRLALGKWADAYKTAQVLGIVTFLMEDVLANSDAQEMRVSHSELFRLAAEAGYPMQALEIATDSAESDDLVWSAVNADLASGSEFINAQDLRAGWYRVIPAS